MASNNFRRSESGSSDIDDNCPRRQGNSSVYSSQSRISDIQRADREALIRQSDRVYAADKARRDAILQRLGLSNQEVLLPSPHPAPRHKRSQALPAHGRRLRPVKCPPPLSVEVVDKDSKSRHQRDDRRSTASSFIGSVDTSSQDEFRATPLIKNPVKGSPTQTSITLPHPTATQPGRRARRIPVLQEYHSGAAKDIGCGYKLCTAETRVQQIEKRLENLSQNYTYNSRQPTVTSKKDHAVTSFTVTSKKDHAVTSFTPAPPPKPEKPPNRGTRRGTTLKPAKAVNVDQMADSTNTLRTAIKDKLKALRPLDNPVQSLSTCLNLLESEDWEKKINGQQIVRALAQHHANKLMVKLHEVCLSMIEQIHHLRSTVAMAAMETMVYLYVYLGRDMDTQVERTGRALLQRIAQSIAKAFLVEGANAALEAMVQSCSAGRVLYTLVTTGLNHACALVRISTAQCLHSLADRLGVATILTAGDPFTRRFVTAVKTMSMDATAEVRPHGHAILKEMTLHRGFTRLWTNIVQEKDLGPLVRILRNAKKS